MNIIKLGEIKGYLHAFASLNTAYAHTANEWYEYLFLQILFADNLTTSVKNYMTSEMMNYFVEEPQARRRKEEYIQKINCITLTEIQNWKQMFKEEMYFLFKPDEFKNYSNREKFEINAFTKLIEDSFEKTRFKVWKLESDLFFLGMLYHDFIFETEDNKIYLMHFDYGS